MISPRLSKVVGGTRLTTDLINSMIKRTEYAADLLQQYKLIAGTEMYIEPHYDGTLVSYFSPVGSGNNPVVPLEYKYRMALFLSQKSIILNSGGPSYLSFQVLLERYTGTGTNADPIIIRTWKTPENYTLTMNDISDTFQDQFLSVSGQYVEILSPSVLLAKKNGNFSFFFTLRDGASNIVENGLATVSYPYAPTLNITNRIFPAGLTNARLIFDYYIGPVVDFSPVQVDVSMRRQDPVTGIFSTTVETFNISPGDFFASGTYTSNKTFVTYASAEYPFGGSSLFLTVSTYFATRTVSFPPN